ncbi:hypothetical protein M3M35_04615 [Fructilactobacillus myrtifloralis]|uniref:ASCH domain-containing protein n=1 Tax=Fructilactobacillus myrtifloralis TaxID=2940301 RepID=A0ABY5BLV3_9LACO|nr:hypothetical protein [Fructilactobacillus myrtifloralis]USS84602.1 hypothetical protein M3M35_04615 [Fructilactobacillus myrtifloralis]
MPTKILEIYDSLLPTLLISIHQEYVTEINLGTKVIEYRKSFFHDPFQAFVYSSGKGGGIATFIQCDQPIVSDADRLARIGSLVGNDDYRELFSYFKPKNTGVIIPIQTAYQIPLLPLTQLREQFTEFTAPQKYTFLDHPNKQALLNYLLEQPIIGKTKNNWHNYYEQLRQQL